MDKYEFNIKIEQIRKLVNKGDFETAMKIADTIDWKKVRNANTLSMVSQIYEKNAEYQDAKDILLLAFERAPIGKRFLYKLTELALKEGNADEAESYYREFCEMSGDDSSQHLLRYMILKARNAPLEQMIHSLESYNAKELDEKWLYELADLYHQAGDAARCVSTCDKIMLMFGLGKYVDKAMELKLQYAPLTEYQMDLVENREKYEAKLRAVEQSFENMMDDDAPEPEAAEEAKALPLPAEQADARRDEDKGAQEAAAAGEEPERAEEHAKAPEPKAAEIPKEPEAEPVSGRTPAAEPKENLGNTRRLPDIRRRLAPEKPVRAEQKEQPAGAGNPARDTVAADVPQKKPAAPAKIKNHLMIEARTPEKGLELALETLKKIQRETGVKNVVARTTGSKLNKNGIRANAKRLNGKDLMIEEAGDLSQETIAELEAFMAAQTTEIRVILIDNPRQMEMLHEKNPALADHFECIAGPDTFKKQVPEAAQPAKEAAPAQPEDSRPVHRAEPPRQVEILPAESAAPEPQEEPEDENEELDIDDFAQYACKYASEIDCSITGKSMLALYERIEIMEEDGIPLTRANAEALIEETADKAEKPGLKGLFSSKYDKAGLLILKEEHFIK